MGQLLVVKGDEAIYAGFNSVFIISVDKPQFTTTTTSAKNYFNHF